MIIILGEASTTQSFLNVVHHILINFSDIIPNKLYNDFHPLKNMRVCPGPVKIQFA